LRTCDRSPTEFRVVNATTLAAARELSAPPTLEFPFRVAERAAGGEAEGKAGRHKGQTVCCLNFASAKNPGGGFLGGSQAQEESLARATGLYACIARVAGYYAANRACGTALYTDHMIHSPAVPVFRGDDNELLPEPYLVSILTAPAVNAGALRRNEPHNLDRIAPVMSGRIEKLLSLALVHGHAALVLGAWGCGVFRNDPAAVAGWFAEHLTGDGRFRDVFDTVVFAVLDTSADGEVIRPFADRFGGGT
ncbi:MAG TPA: TIGR02452 family protein, partial [Gemmataceae bacterium]